MESENRTIKINLPDGTAEYYTLTEEEYQSWEVAPEGYINYNGIIAYYERGDDQEDILTDRLYGCVDNLPNAGLTLEGDGIEGYRKGIRSAVNSLFEDFDQYGKPRRKFNAAGTLNATIEFYVHDPVILNFFYNRYPHKKVPHKTYVVPLHPRFEEQEVPFRMAA
jgi:hypothetical protein